MGKKSGGDSGTLQLDNCSNVDEVRQCIDSYIESRPFKSKHSTFHNLLRSRNAQMHIFSHSVPSMEVRLKNRLFPYEHPIQTNRFEFCSDDEWFILMEALMWNLIYTMEYDGPVRGKNLTKFRGENLFVANMFRNQFQEKNMLSEAKSQLQNKFSSHHKPLINLLQHFKNAPSDRKRVVFRCTELIKLLHSDQMVYIPNRMANEGGPIGLRSESEIEQQKVKEKKCGHGESTISDPSVSSGFFEIMDASIDVKNCFSRAAHFLSRLGVFNGHILKKISQDCWRRHYCVLVPHLFLYYYESDDAEFPRGIIDMEFYRNAHVDDEGVVHLEPSDDVPLRTFQFKADGKDGVDIGDFVTALHCERHSVIKEERDAYKGLQDMFSNSMNQTSEERERAVGQLAAEQQLVSEYSAQIQHLLQELGMNPEQTGNCEDMGEALSKLKELALSSVKSARESHEKRLREEALMKELEEAGPNEVLLRQETQLHSYKQQLQLSSRLLEEKTRELQVMTHNFKQSQHAAQLRECELQSDLKTIKEKASRLEDINSWLMEEIAKIKIEKPREDFGKTIPQEAPSCVDAPSSTALEATGPMMKRLQEVQQALAIEKELRAYAEARESEERRGHTAAASQLVATEAVHRVEKERWSQQLKDQTAAWQDKECAFLKENERLKALLAESKEAEAGLVAECASLRRALDDLSSSPQNAVPSAPMGQVDEVARISNELERMRKRNEDLAQMRAVDVDGHSARVKELEEKVKQLETARRKLHNLVQELRGNVRVLVRVRPFLPGEDSEEGNAVSEKPNNQWGSIKIHPNGTDLSVEQSGGRLGLTGSKLASDPANFKFDKVLAPNAGQAEVFNEVQDLVQSALDGFNVCILCYGQTGSGKTHTMQGAKSGPMQGIIPRTIQQLGEAKEKLEENGWCYSMEASFLEIYNDQIQDLVHDGRGPKVSHEIKKTRDGQLYVTGLRMIPIDPKDSSSIEDLMRVAHRNRTTAKTDMNERSSRSHSVFTLHLHALNKGLEAEFDGKIHLVDLAGSERLSKSNATGQRLKETQAINSSLSSLSDVFSSIAQQNSHIPFRNSKLTFLLQPALSGDGKTLMLVNISPTGQSYHESLCSLRFANNVHKCELGRPKRQIRQFSTRNFKSKLTKVL